MIKRKRYELLDPTLQFLWIFPTLIALFGTIVPVRSATASIQQQAAVGVYEENFTTYANRATSENVRWDIWSGSLTLDIPDALGQFRPQTVTDGDGNTYMAWIDRRTGTYSLYIQKVDGNGNRLWPEDQRVHAGEQLKSQFVRFAVTAAADHSAVVVWADSQVLTSADLTALYAQKITPDGQRAWSSDLLISSTGISNWSYPDVGADGDGYFLIVWMGESNNGQDNDIYAQRYNGQGTAQWEQPIRVNTAHGFIRMETPTIAVSPQGWAIVTYIYPGSSYRVVAQKIDGLGQTLWNDRQVSQYSGAVTQRNPSIALDSSGGAWIAWEDSRDGDQNIYTQQIDTDGNPLWTTDIRLNSDVGTAVQARPVVAAGTAGSQFDGSFMVAWEDSRNSNTDIYAQVVGAGGYKLLPEDLLVNSDIGIANQASPSITSGQGDDAVLVWSDGRSGNDALAQRVSFDGVKRWLADARVHNATANAIQREPVLALDLNRNGFLAWVDYRAGLPVIVTRKVDPNGNRLWAQDVQVSDRLAQSDIISPSLAVYTDGTATIVWQDNRDGRRNIYSQRVDGNGNRLWTDDHRVNLQSGEADRYSPVLAIDTNGNTLVAWTDYRSGNPDVYCQKLDPAGVPVWTSDIRVNTDTGITSQAPTAIAVRSDGSAYILWNDYRNETNTSDVYAQRILVDGTLAWEEDIRVNSDATTTMQNAGAAAVTTGGDLIAAWVDNRSGNMDINGQRISPVGAKLWPSDIRLHVDNSGANQFVYGRLGLSRCDDDSLSVVWMDSRNQQGVLTNYDLYMQRVEPSGNLLWPFDVKVNSDSGLTDQTNPAASCSGDLTTMVAWVDKRNGNEDIYAQRVNEIGGKAWMLDLRVIYPDLFYFSHGTAQSIEIDSFSENITQATLTADFHANGGGVRFWLSNNGGADWIEARVGVPVRFPIAASRLRWKAELSSDPLWPRTPELKSLRVVYSTQSANADSYEADDNCGEAQAISVDGTAQEHTSHQPGDNDWVWFDATAGTNYIVETINTGTQSNTELVILSGCFSNLTGTARSFGNGYSVSFTAAMTGRHYVRASQQNPMASGVDTAYTLSVRALRPSAVAIIAAGQDGSHNEESSILYAADRAYRIFLNAGLGKANIHYLAPVASHDADGDASSDVAALTSPESLRDSIQSWARERGVGLGVPLFIYLVDHGLTDRFKASGDAVSQQVNANDLNLWISNLEATTGIDNITMIIDACYSGSFIDVTPNGPGSLSGHGRVIVSSTTSNGLAYGPADGRGLYFSNSFFGGLENQQSVWASYSAGRQAVLAQGLGQLPWLDDNGDQIMDSQDGVRSGMLALRQVTLGGQPPRLEWVDANLSTGVLQVRVLDDSTWIGVHVEVFAPTFQLPGADGSGTTRLLDVPVIVLTDADRDGIYTARGSFTDTGSYHLVAQAEDSEGNLALPASIDVHSGYQIFVPITIR